MPELPEVETIRLGLRRLIVKKKLAGVNFDNAKSFPNAEADVNKFMIGASIQDVRRRGKVLMLDLDSGYSLLIHLKMTGQLVFDDSRTHFGAGHPGPALVHRLPDKSTHVSITFADTSKLYFNDQRKFGWVRLYPSSHIEQLPFFSKLGPEPLSKNFTAAVLKTRLVRRSGSPVKAALMDQAVIAGVGNIYADESLWGARIHPATLVGALSVVDYKRLHSELLMILKLSLAKGGSTDRNYVDAEGRRGSYLDFARVFRRDGQPCPRCGTTIVKLRLAGRGTHICPKCQTIKSKQII